MNIKLFKLSFFGTVLSAICCFTPLLVWILSAAGLSSAILWLDGVLIPTLVFFIGLMIYALIAKQRG